MQRKIIDPWIAASGGPGVPLDLSKAPFRLLAIVNRLDLRDQVAYGGTSGGELRFVFMYMPPGCVSTGQPFEVILKYGLPVSGCLNLKAFATQWKALDALRTGSAAYNAALEAITQRSWSSPNVGWRAHDRGRRSWTSPQGRWAQRGSAVPLHPR